MWRSPDDNTLIFSFDHHVSVHVVSQGVDVGWILILGLSTHKNDSEFRVAKHNITRDKR